MIKFVKQVEISFCCVINCLHESSYILPIICSVFTGFLQMCNFICSHTVSLSAPPFVIRFRYISLRWATFCNNYVLIDHKYTNQLQDENTSERINFCLLEFFSIHTHAVSVHMIIFCATIAVFFFIFLLLEEFVCFFFSVVFLFTEA